MKSTYTIRTRIEGGELRNILIFGANSFIGNATKKHLIESGYSVTVIDSKGDEWHKLDFTPFDSIFYVAGIAHDTGRKKDAELYYKVNYQLAIDVATKAKQEKIKQFVFMSSMLVYNGVKERQISLNTEPKVKGCYGGSKLKADLELQAMDSEDFKVAVLRPPMIFGEGCRGNFPRLVSLSKKLRFFPRIKNIRSILYIDNLTEIVRLIIENDSRGVFFPQDPEYFCTSDMLKALAVRSEKKLTLTRLMNLPVWILYPFLSPLRKLFGNLTYDKSLSTHFENSYQIKTTQEGIREYLEQPDEIVK